MLIIYCVLILVFMEVILLHHSLNSFSVSNSGFNPCFYGSYSFTLHLSIQIRLQYLVLILVFMEVILLLVETQHIETTTS